MEIVGLARARAADAHAERRARFADRAADRAHAEDRDGLAVHAAGLARLERVRLLRSRERGQITGEREDHREHVIAHLGEVDAARVRDPDALGQARHGPERIRSGAERLQELEARRA